MGSSPTTPDSGKADVETMVRLQQGDDLALNELMDRWQKPLVAYLMRMLGNEATALDLAEETFVRVHENRARYHRSGKFSTWLYTIATNLARSFHRWRGRHPTVSLDGAVSASDDRALSESVPVLGDTPAEAAARSDLAAVVQEAVASLPPDLREVVVLFEYEDLGYEAISAILGCTEKAVETRLYRARQFLRKRLVAAGVAE